MTPDERAELNYPTRCPYCGSGVTLGSSAAVYHGRDYGSVYICNSYPVCDAYVGVHRGTDQAKGRLANAELRRAKIAAHKAFDALWPAAMSRKDAYRLMGELMGELMGLPPEERHIGWFTVEQCRELIHKLEGLKL